MKFLGYLFLLITITTSCCPEEQRKPEVSLPVEFIDSLEVEQLNSLMTDTIINRYKAIGLFPVTDTRIIIDLRYATSNNFMKKQLYDTLDHVYLQKIVVDRISACQDFLDSIKPGYRLKIYDGVRPLQVQREMWNALDTVPMWRRGKFVSNPIFGSVHNYGCAVDVTICNEEDEELDMGAGYDDFRDIAFPSKEKEFLESGELSTDAYKNRLLLRSVMRSQYFSNIPSEWWHFNAFSRPTSEKKFELLLSESGEHQIWVSPKIIFEAEEPIE